MSGNGVLLIIEFMKPKVPVDFDHLVRFEEYVETTRHHVNTSTGGAFHKVLGYLVADKLDRKGPIGTRVKLLAEKDMRCMDWSDLLYSARRQWRHYFDVLIARSPSDERIKEIKDRNEALV